MPFRLPFGDYEKRCQYEFGAQDWLVFSQVPTTAAQSLVGKRIIDAGVLTVAGDYYAVACLSGMRDEARVHLTATFTTGTVASAVYTAYKSSTPQTSSGLVSYQAFSGTGAMVSTTRQSDTLATPLGEEFIVVKLTVAGTPDILFTQAEYNGV